MRCDRSQVSALPVQLPTMQAMTDNGPQVDEQDASAYKNEFNRKDYF